MLDCKVQEYLSEFVVYCVALGKVIKKDEDVGAMWSTFN